MTTPRTFRLATAAFVASLGIAATSPDAAAAPYAFASNQITGLTVTFLPATPVPQLNLATTSITDSANFNGFPGTTYSNPNVPIGTPNNITMATAGTGSFGAENNFDPVGPGAFNGTRSDAFVGGGGAASGGVTVSNVAEASSPSGSGNAQSGNQANIQFTVLGTGQQLRVAGTDLIQLTATAAVGESATATISNSLSLQGGGTNFFANNLGDINLTIGSGSIGPTSVAFEVITPILQQGVRYTLTLGSQAIVTITPAATPVPEPTSLALLGAGLLGFAALRRRS